MSINDKFVGKFRKYKPGNLVRSGAAEVSEKVGGGIFGMTLSSIIRKTYDSITNSGNNSLKDGISDGTTQAKGYTTRKRKKYTSGPSSILPRIIGLPPEGYIDGEIIEHAFPTLLIKPCKPETHAGGLSIYKLDPVINNTSEQDTYSPLLNSLGYNLHPQQIDRGGITIAYVADNFPTDTFTNEYGESFLNTATNFASSAFGDIAQLTGSDSGLEVIEKITKRLGGVGEEGGMYNNLMTGISDKARKMDASIQGAGGLKGMGRIISGMLAGKKVDFPQVWKNSGFTPSYTITVRLYNPNPGSLEMTKKYIIGPLAALLILGLPRSDGDNLYKWPFFHQIYCPGIFTLAPAAISNITVIKGGDQQQIAWNQKLGIVDVRLDFVSTYGSMVVGPATNRPTLKDYLKALETDSPDKYLKQELFSPPVPLSNKSDRAYAPVGVGASRGSRNPFDVIRNIKLPVGVKSAITFVGDLDLDETTGRVSVSDKNKSQILEAAAIQTLNILT